MSLSQNINNLFNCFTALGGSVYNHKNLSTDSNTGYTLLISHELSLTGAPIALMHLGMTIKKAGRQPIFLSFSDGPLTENCIAHEIPVLIISQDKALEFLRDNSQFFSLIVANTISTAPFISLLNGSAVPVLWWIHESNAAYDPVYLADMPFVLCSNITVLTAGPIARNNLLKYRPLYNTSDLLYWIPPAESVKRDLSFLPEASKNKFVFALVGSLEFRKGQDILLDVADLLPKDIFSGCFFVFVGNPVSASMHMQISAAVKKHPENMYYIPQIPRDEMDAFYSETDCLICASREDPMPVTVTEAFQNHVPVICSEGTGTADLIKQYNAGLTFPVGDCEKLAECISIISTTDISSFEEMCSGGRQLYTDHFTEEVFLDHISDIINDPNREIPTAREIAFSKLLQEMNSDCLEKENMIFKLRSRLNSSLRENHDISRELDSYRNSYSEILSSETWNATRPLRYTLDVMKGLNPHSRHDSPEKSDEQDRIIRPETSMYSLFSEEDLINQRNTVFSRNICFSIIVPLFNTKENYLREMIQSVLNQTYANWELCLADGSDNDHTDIERICLEYADCDTRIRYKRIGQNLGISGNTNVALKMATGNYIALFDHDDILHPSALYEMMRVICYRNADLIYTDECTFRSDTSNITFAHFKPDYAPDTLRANNYICHFTAFSSMLLKKVGGFNSEYDGSQDYDMILRLTENARLIVHIPKVLYFWRAHEGSVASDIDAKPYALVAARKAISAHLKRLGLNGTVTDSELKSMYRIRYEISGSPLVSILIPNSEHVDDLKRCLDSIYEKTTYNNFEIIVIENNSHSNEIFSYYNTIRESHTNLKVVNWNGDFNYPAINSFGASHAGGDYLILLNNDTEIISADWIQEMLMFAQRDDVGAVGAKLYYPDNTIQHAGIGIGLLSLAAHYFRHNDYRDPGYMGRMKYAQNLSAVTGACCMIRKNVWDEINGMDENFAVAFNDVDMCMKIRKAGYLIVWTPFAELYHYESKSRGADDTVEKRQRFNKEVLLFNKKWGKELCFGDPYFNPYFSENSELFVIDSIDAVKDKIQLKDQLMQRAIF